MKIFLLEDDELLFEIIEEFLVEKGNSVKACKDGLEAEAILLKEKFDLLLLDVQVPSVNGFALLQGLRNIQNHTPAIFITALNGTKDLKYGFEVGGDDYIKKPFDLLELEARIKNLKKHYCIQDKILIHPSFEFDSVNFTLSDHSTQKSFTLTQKENALLLYFCTHPNRVLTLEELATNLWAYESPPTQATLRSYIKTLRRYLGFERITNIKGNGYRFNQI
ncbi:DNA-binding response regulator [Helicobacter cholecystus]|uniref:DNA-binding response regulator n=1 Tax=Helicobacter cholecystus TaxID=45498 RepID=A0A3D8IWQ3_9HELI|nr:response regulator transcription factor [Helicobacter cholecystus]RDU69473.1 DNA-binding response regulator [Helicobacter cholecystus]VEJ24024.1 two-component regulation system CdrRS, regulator component CdrR [Helicobacter cholecystus]